MRIMGVDPGSRTTGYAILDVKKGGKLQVKTFGILKPHAKKSLPERLDTIFQGLLDILKKYQPMNMAVEEVFFAQNVKSALALGQVRGGVLLAGVSNGLPIYSYSATKIKQAVSGNGRADKAQVQRMVMKLLSLKIKPDPDAADALAIALCHASSYRMRNYDRLFSRKNITKNS